MDILNEFTKTANKQVLLYAASKHIFCPNCNKILDYKTVIILEVWNKHITQYHGQQVCCKSCLKKEAISAVEKKQGIRIFITQF